MFDEFKDLMNSRKVKSQDSKIKKLNMVVYRSN